MESTVTEPKGSNFSVYIYRKSIVSEMFDIGDPKPLNSRLSSLEVDCGSAIKASVRKKVISERLQLQNTSHR